MTFIDSRPPLVGAPATVEPPPVRTLLDVFDATVARWGARLAVETASARLTYRELADAADDLAARLRELGIGPGDRVGIRMSSGTADLYVAILAVLRAGAAYVPVDADDPPRRVEDVLARASVAALIEDGPAIALREPAVGRDGVPRPDDDAWIIFTSGSTGAPKGVAVSHASAAAFVDAEALLWTVRPEDRVLAGLSVAFDASCEELWLAWRHGATLVPAPRSVVRAGVDLGPWLAERGITVVSTVPTLASLWDDDVVAGVRLLILGGEALPAALGWRLAAGRELWNTYGPTEATVVSTAARVVAGEPIRIGRPLAGWDVAVVDEAGRPVPAGAEGELVIAGAGLGRYLDAALDAERYAPLPACGWERAYRSGDIVRDTPDGLAFVGRRDHQVKIGGRRVELGEIEAHLAAVAGVRAAAAVTRTTEGGTTLLVGYVVGDVEARTVREAVAPSLPDGLVPLVVVLDALPVRNSGKIDTAALPWPVVAEPTGDDVRLTATEAWLAAAWRVQLGPFAATAEADFFELGGTSVAVARLVSGLRERVPTVAVADVYEHRSLRALAARLDSLGCSDPLGSDPAGSDPKGSQVDRRWGLVRCLGVLVLLGVMAGEWLVGVLAYDRLAGGNLPAVGWGWLAAAWLVLASPPSRTAIVLAARPLLLGRLRPGRYRRASWLAARIWFLERLAEVCRVGHLAGTPWAPRYARLFGIEVGPGARLATLPAPGALLRIGAEATVEADVDMRGWWLDGAELVVGRVEIGDRARIGMRALLMPGAVVEAGAEVEPGSVVSGVVPAGERWAGSPARRVGLAGECWPAEPGPRAANPRPRRLLYAAGLLGQTVLPLLALGPVVGVGLALGLAVPTDRLAPGALLLESFVLTAVSLVAYAVLVAIVVRALGRMLRTGWQPDDSLTAWTLWCTENVMATARAVLFPLLASLYTRPWLRLLGIRVGRRTEISTVVGLNRLVRFGAYGFATDDVVVSNARARDGWLYVAPTVIGDGTFLGNSAQLDPGTTLGDGCLVGALTMAPVDAPHGTSWFGAPAIELPRVRKTVDRTRTTDPPRRLIVARGAMDLLRILAPSTASVMLALLVLSALQGIGTSSGIVAMTLAAPLLLLAGGVIAAALTVAAKWLVIGRYRIGEHPLWSLFVWRDELINSTQEQLAGAWLLGLAMGTPIMSLYLRALGARVGRDVWCETLALTEFDLVTLGDGAVVNRHAVVETHLFHDRVLSLGPATLEAGATLGPSSAVLPDTRLGAGCSVGGRSVVLRGEELPPHTRWAGAPVVGA